MSKATILNLILATVLLLLWVGCGAGRRSGGGGEDRQRGGNDGYEDVDQGNPNDWPTEPKQERPRSGYPQNAATIAPDRYVFTANGHELAIPIKTSHDLDGTHREVRRLIVCVPAVGKQIVGLQGRLMRFGEQEGLGGQLAVVGLQFPNPRDYIAEGITDSRRLLYWDQEDWVFGYESASFPSAPRPAMVPGYEIAAMAIEDMLEAFPNVETIIVTGSSAGGNWTHRFTAGTHLPEEHPSIHWGFVSSAQGLMFYLNNERAINDDRDEFTTITECPRGLAYPFGPDSLEKNPWVARRSPQQLRDVYETRNIVHLIGTRDDEVRAYYKYCTYKMQGLTRIERHRVWRRYIEHLYGEGIFQRQEVYELPGFEHGDDTYGTPIGRELLYHWTPGVDPLPQWNGERVTN